MTRMRDEIERRGIVNDIEMLAGEVSLIARQQEIPLADLKSIQRSLAKWIERQTTDADRYAEYVQQRAGAARMRRNGR